MSELKKENITELHPSIKNASRFPTQFIHNVDIENILINNMALVANNWFRFQSEWTYNAYKTLKDLDKYLILIYLIQKTFNHYSDTFLILSEKTLYDSEKFEIEKINLIEISEELNIPKETVRRKINELNKTGFIERLGKRIIIRTGAFAKQRPVQTVKLLSTFLSTVSQVLSDQNKNIINSPIEALELENFIRSNFTLIWKFYFRTQIPNLVEWRNFYGDLETWAVAGTVLINQMHKLRDKYKGKGVMEDSEKFSNDEKFRRSYENALSKGNEITGVNASSISEVSGIPRATVIRKLKHGLKMGVLERDKNQLYTIKKMKAPKLKEFLQIGKTIQFRIYGFIGTFFDLYKNRERMPKAK